jgi:hypothetical protein
MSDPYKQIEIASIERNQEFGGSTGSAVFTRQERTVEKIHIMTTGNFSIDPSTLKVIADTLADDITPTN